MCKNIVLLVAICLFSYSISIAQSADVEGDVVIPAANAYTYAEPKTKYLTVPFSAFRSNDPNGYDYQHTGINYYGVLNNGFSGFFGYASAFVQLPNDAKIKKIRVWCYDNLSTAFIRVSLFEAPVGGGSPLAIAVTETTSGSANTNIRNLTDDANPANDIVNNLANGYFLQLDYSNSDTDELRFYSVRIQYTVVEVD